MELVSLWFKGGEQSLTPTIDVNRMIDMLKAQIGELAVAVAVRDIRIEELQAQLAKPKEETA